MQCSDVSSRSMYVDFKYFHRYLAIVQIFNLMHFNNYPVARMNVLGSDN